MGSRALAQELWHMGLVVPHTWDLPRPGMKPVSPALAGGLFTIELPRKPLSLVLRPVLVTLEFYL